MDKTVSADAQSRLFVIPDGNGSTCFGFDVCYAHALQLSQLLRRPDLAPRKDEIGKVSQYDGYRRLVELAKHADLGTYFDPGTPERLREVLEAYRISNKRLRLFYGDAETGRDWLEEFGMIGRIGRSSGALKVPLLMQTPRSRWGGPILTACVVRLQDGAAGRELYRHPHYHQPVLALREGPTDLPAEVWANDQVHARFRTQAQALRWLAFIQGKRRAR